MTNEQSDRVFPPDLVTVSVAELYKLREEAALLAALRIANVEAWHGYRYAQWLFEHDPDIWNIKQGWKSVLTAVEDRHEPQD